MTTAPNPTPPKPPRKSVLRRSAIAAAPIAISQENCLQYAGIDERRFLELLRDHPEIPRAEIGKLRVVDATELLAALRALATTTASDAIEVDANDPAQPETPDAVLRLIGRNRLPPMLARARLTPKGAE